MDGQRKGSQSSRSLAITSGGHVTDTDHMVSRPKKVASLLPCPDGQPHEEQESDRAATPFQITMPDRIFVHMVKRAKPRRSQDGSLVVAGMVGLDGGILAAGVSRRRWRPYAWRWSRLCRQLARCRNTEHRHLLDPPIVNAIESCPSSGLQDETQVAAIQR